MKCVVCLTEVEDGDMNCPNCQEHMGQWLELREAGRQLIREGIEWIARGEPVRSALSLAKATVLLPDDAQALKVYGQVLGSLKMDAESQLYLQKAQNARLMSGMPEDPQISAALAALAARGSKPAAEGPSKAAGTLGGPDHARDA